MLEKWTTSDRCWRCRPLLTDAGDVDHLGQMLEMWTTSDRCWRCGPNLAQVLEMAMNRLATCIGLRQRAREMGRNGPGLRWMPEMQTRLQTGSGDGQHVLLLRVQKPTVCMQACVNYRQLLCPILTRFVSTM